MMVLLLVAVVLAAAFGGVLLRGAPYLPTTKVQAQAALDLLDLQSGQILLELGSGDGKVLVLAAQAGLCVVGIELNPFLVVISRLRTWRYRKQVRILWGDFWRTDWPECDAVFTFLLDRFMLKLDAKMQTVRKPLVSFAFQVPGRTANAEKAGVYLYNY
jgi:SAM-dependent methyltransferase